MLVGRGKQARPKSKSQFGDYPTRFKAPAMINKLCFGPTDPSDFDASNSFVSSNQKAFLVCL